MSFVQKFFKHKVVQAGIVALAMGFASLTQPFAVPAQAYLNLITEAWSCSGYIVAGNYIGALQIRRVVVDVDFTLDGVLEQINSDWRGQAFTRNLFNRVGSGSHSVVTTGTVGLYECDDLLPNNFLSTGNDNLWFNGITYQCDENSNQRNSDDGWNLVDTKTFNMNYSQTACVAPTPTPTVTPTATPTSTPTPTNTPTPTQEPTPTPTQGVTPTPEVTPTGTPTVTPEVTPQVTPTSGPTPTDTPHKEGKESSLADDNMCVNGEFEAVFDLKDNGNPTKDVTVKFEFNGSTKETKTNDAGRAKVTFSAGAGTVKATADGYPTQYKTIEDPKCPVVHLDPDLGRGGQVLGVSTLAATGSALFNILGFSSIALGLYWLRRELRA